MDSSVPDVFFGAPILFEMGEDGVVRSSEDDDWVSYPYPREDLW